MLNISQREYSSLDYDVVTLDTNIFKQNGYALETGLLGQLQQFKEGSAEFVLSEIVIKEVIRHMTDAAYKVRAQFETAVRKSSELGLSSGLSTEELDTFKNNLLPAKEAVKERIERFMKETGAIFISAGHADMQKLVNSYFKPLPPFENSGDKKNEFPDAIALLSLEQWAMSNRKKVLAISSDAGWKSFSDNSYWVDVESDLSVALGKLQAHADIAVDTASKFLAALENGRYPDWLNYIEEQIAQNVSDMSPFGEGDSHLQIEFYETYLDYKEYSFVNIEDVHLIRVGKDRIVVSLLVEISAEAHGSADFAVYDSIDKDYVSMGSNSCSAEVNETLPLLIEFMLQDCDEEPFEIGNVEFAEEINSIDFGYIEPDWSDDYYDYAEEQEAQANS